MLGYKLLDEGLKNQYGMTYKLGEKYFLNGKLVWSKNGFHFCDKPESTLRYAKDKNSFLIAEIEADGEIICGDDYGDNEYYGCEGLYASTQMTIKRLLERKEVIDIIVNSKNEYRVSKLIKSTKLTNEEIDLILSKYSDEMLKRDIEYYQYGIEDAYILKKKVIY